MMKNYILKRGSIFKVISHISLISIYSHVGHCFFLSVAYILELVKQSGNTGEFKASVLSILMPLT